MHSLTPMVAITVGFAIGIASILAGFATLAWPTLAFKTYDRVERSWRKAFWRNDWNLLERAMLRMGWRAGIPRDVDLRTPQDMYEYRLRFGYKRGIGLWAMRLYVGLFLLFFGSMFLLGSISYVR